MALVNIDSCGECRHRRTQPDYTEDSFERPEKWLCSKARERIIVRYQEWNDPDPGIPDWCPLRPENTEK